VATGAHDEVEEAAVEAEAELRQFEDRTLP
jgi:hypothetical protein